MKANEWAARLEAAEDIVPVLEKFMAEIGDIAGARGGTPNAVEGAVREQKDKFMAVCRMTDCATPEMWRPMMEDYGGPYLPGIRSFVGGAKKVKPGRGRAGTKRLARRH